MIQKPQSGWDILFYLSLASLLIWLILKLTGVINSPPLLEYGFPILSVALAFFTLYQGLNNRLAAISIGVARTETKVEYIEKEMGIIKLDVARIETEVKKMWER